MTAVAVVVPAALELLTVTVKPIELPALTVAASAILVMARFGQDCCTSKAPMSTTGLLPQPLMREKPVPRWSVVTPPGTSALLPLSNAGLLVVIAIVSVDPPLFCSEPSSGLPVCDGLPVVVALLRVACAITRLLPLKVTVAVLVVLPSRLSLTRSLVPPLVVARIVLLNVTVAVEAEPSSILLPKARL